MKKTEKILTVTVLTLVIGWGLLALPRRRTKVVKETLGAKEALPKPSPEEALFEKINIPDAQDIRKTWDLVCDPFIKLGTKEKQEETPNLILEGVIWSEKPPRLAVINDSTVTEGDTIFGFKVVEIQKNKVILTKEGKQYTINLGGQ